MSDATENTNYQPRLTAANLRPLLNHLRLYALCLYALIRRALSSKFRVGVITMRLSRARFYETMWARSARAVGVPFVLVTGRIGRLGYNGRTLEVLENKTSLEPEPTLQLARNKARVRSILIDARLPVPKQVSIGIRDFQAALAFLSASKGPIVVKPAADTGGGAGVSTNVNTERQLRAAVAWARAYGKRLLLEEQIEGNCYRVLIMHGNVIDVVVRRPLQITGDGHSTIRQLIQHENMLRRRIGISRAQMLVRIDPDLRNTLAAQKLRLSSRPPAHTQVVLKRVINENKTTDNHTANGLLCASILDSARLAALTLKIHLAGIDLICSDPSLPLEQTGGAIIEVNVNPGLYYHYSPEHTDYPVTQDVLTRYFHDGASSVFTELNA